MVKIEIIDVEVGSKKQEVFFMEFKNKVNDFVKGKTVKDIKFSTYATATTMGVSMFVHFVAMIIYE